MWLIPPDGIRCDDRVVQEGLGLGVIQQRHEMVSVRTLSPSHDSG